jgi:hypothetical protein
MGPNVRKVVEPGFESSLEVLLKKGPERAKAQHAFELFPESFDDGNGAGLADGAESMPDTEAEEELPESRVRKLRPTIGDKMSRNPETPRGFEKNDADLLSGRFFGEDAERERHSRKHIQDDGDLELKESEEAGNIGHVGHPNVAWITSLDGTPSESFQGRSFRFAGRWFLAYPSNRFRRELPPGPSKGLSDELVSTESEPRHVLN